MRGFILLAVIVALMTTIAVPIQAQASDEIYITQSFDRLAATGVIQTNDIHNVAATAIDPGGDQQVEIACCLFRSFRAWRARARARWRSRYAGGC